MDAGVGASHPQHTTPVPYPGGAPASNCLPVLPADVLLRERVPEGGVDVVDRAVRDRAHRRVQGRDGLPDQVAVALLAEDRVRVFVVAHATHLEEQRGDPVFDGDSVAADGLRRAAHVLAEVAPPDRIDRAEDDAAQLLRSLQDIGIHVGGGRIEDRTRNQLPVALALGALVVQVHHVGE